MTNSINPQDLKVGDVVDVTFRRMKIDRIGDDGLHLTTVNDELGYISWKILSNATITKSPEVIEAGDVVQSDEIEGVVLSIAKGHAMVETDNGSIWLKLLSDLTLVSKGAKS